MNRNLFWTLLLGFYLLLPVSGFSREPCDGISDRAQRAQCQERFAQRPAFAESARSSIKAIALSELPSEARLTVRLIRQGGPFRYDRDGVVFHNRERLLPIRKAGYYREYTVPTPGGKDRGARRIISGREGELYYTADHYSSFTRVRE